MTDREALQILAQNRGEKIVVTAMTAAGQWPGISDTPLDFCYLPSSMGQASSLGLGLALAVAPRGVVVVNGDGSTLMNLGNLVTIASHPVNLYLIVLDNGIYQVTGGQPNAGNGVVDFCAMARGAGIARVYDFDAPDRWRAGAAEALDGDGPVFIRLAIPAVYGEKEARPPRPMAEQIRRLRGALLSGEDHTDW